LIKARLKRFELIKPRKYMTNSRPIFRSVVVCAIATLTLSACVVAPHPRAVYAQPAAVQPEIVVGIAPPPPYVEIIPVVPFAGAVWIGGYWGWSGGRHQWVPGRYDYARPGYRWQAHQWSPGLHGNWYLRGGGWIR
jgi:hypothetical protein